MRQEEEKGRREGHDGTKQAPGVALSHSDQDLLDLAGWLTLVPAGKAQNGFLVTIHVARPLPLGKALLHRPRCTLCLLGVLWCVRWIEGLVPSVYGSLVVAM